MYQLRATVPANLVEDHREMYELQVLKELLEKYGITDFQVLHVVTHSADLP